MTEPIIKTASVKPHIVKPPLEIWMTLEPWGGIPTQQKYDILDGGFYPDYRVTPLYVVPRLSIQSRDDAALGEQLTADGTESADFSSTVWTWSEDGGTPAAVVAGSGSAPDFSFPGLVDPDIPTHALCIRRNTAVGKDVAIFLRATYTYQGTAYELEASIRLTAIDEGDGIPTLQSDVPRSMLYNPLRDEEKMEINLSLLNKSGAFAPSDWEAEWQKRMEDAQGNETWRRIELHLSTNSDGSPKENADDAEFALTDSGRKMVIDRTLMNPECILRVKVKYKGKDGLWYGYKARSGADAGYVPQLDFHYRRRIPDNLTLEIQGAPNCVAPGVQTLHYRAVVTDPIGILGQSGEVSGTTPDGKPIYRHLPEDWLDCRWYGYRGNASGTQSDGDRELLGTGFEIDVDPAIIDGKYGAGIRAEVSDRGPLAVLVDSDGSILADDDGSWLVG